MKQVVWRMRIHAYGYFWWARRVVCAVAGHKPFVPEYAADEVLWCERHCGWQGEPDV